MMNATTALNVAQSKMPILWDADRPSQSAAATFCDSGGKEGFPSTFPPSTSCPHTIQPSYLRQVSHRSKKKHAQGREFSHFSRQKSHLCWQRKDERRLCRNQIFTFGINKQISFAVRLLKDTLRYIDFKS